MQMSVDLPFAIILSSQISSFLSSLLFTGTQLAVNFHYTESDCVKWYIFQEVGTQLLVAAVEFILIIRGTVLYPSARPLTDRNVHIQSTRLV